MITWKKCIVSVPSGTVQATDDMMEIILENKLNMQISKNIFAVGSHHQNVNSKANISILTLGYITLLLRDIIYCPGDTSNMVQNFKFKYIAEHHAVLDVYVDVKKIENFYSIQSNVGIKKIHTWFLPLYFLNFRIHYSTVKLL